MNGAPDGDGLRIAPVYDGRDPVTGPYFTDDRDRISDRAERMRIAAFMRDGLVVLRSTARDLDVIDPGRGTAVPGSFRTDGTWVWNDALMYYVREHGIAPSAEFYAHVVACGYQCPDPPLAAAEAALRRLIPG